MRYHSRGAQLAPAVAHPVGPFGQSVRDAVQIARQAPDLTPTERQFLDDLMRCEERYKHTTLERLCGILARVENDVLRASFPEAVLAAIAAHGGQARALSVAEALRQETSAQAEADPAQLEVALNPETPLSTVDRAIANTQRQLAAGRALLASLTQIRFHRLHRGHA